MASSAPKLSTAPRRDLAGPALRAFFNITRLWGLTTYQELAVLGNPGPCTFVRWTRDRDGGLQQDALERISYLLGMWKSLQLLFAVPYQADAGVKRPNDAPLFGGRSE